MHFFRALVLCSLESPKVSDNTIYLVSFISLGSDMSAQLLLTYTSALRSMTDVWIL